MSDFLPVAIQAVKRAETEILKHYEQQVDVDLKTDLTPVTLADRDGERVIIEEIKKYFPNHGFLGEEETDNKKGSTDYTWIIDPIDGTKNYIRGIPLFATQLALMYKNELILGVSNAPALKELIYAQKGGGCFLNEKKIQVSKISVLNEAFMSFGSIHYFEELNKLDKLVLLSKLTRGHKGFGDCWSYHLLAEGHVDIVLEGKIRIWDVAAASVIMSEAGGKMTDMDGKNIGLETTNAFGSNGLLHNEVLKIINS